MATEFIVTFGVKYEYEQHPIIPSVDPEGVMLLTGVRDETDARQILYTWLDQKYSMIYERESWEEDPRNKQYFPKGITIEAKVYEAPKNWLKGSRGIELKKVITTYTHFAIREFEEEEDS